MKKKVGLLTAFIASILVLFSPYVYAENIKMDGIKIESATYGGNCGVVKGNATAHISNQCNGKPACRYTVDHKIIGDPAPGCTKTYTVRYRCGAGSRAIEKSLSAEAGWGDKSVGLKCR